MISSKPNKIILIGASTGGPGLIERIITSLNAPINATIVIAQHMDSFHLHSFAKRLNRINSLEVELVTKQMNLCSGMLYLLEDTTSLHAKDGTVYFEKESSHKGYYHPTINELFLSAAELKGVGIKAYLLSGIGADGAEGLLQLKKAHHETVAQDEDTSIVYGMPKAAAELNAVTSVMSIENIIKDIRQEVI